MDRSPTVSRCGVFAVAALALLQLTVAQAQERRYPLADRGTLVLAVPGGWEESIGRRDALTPPTIQYRPAAGAPFRVLVTPIWPMKQEMALPAAREMRQSVLKAAEALKGQALEKSFEAIELKGPAASGYYFRATDRAPKPGEFKYLAQGMLALGELRVTFTILTNDGQQAAVAAALEMLRNARLDAPRAAATRPRAPGALPPPDLPKLRALFEAGNFGELDAALGAYQAAYRNGAIGDEEAARGIFAFTRRDADRRVLYDRWVAEHPASYVARLARAYYLVRLGYLARGKAYSRDTTTAQFAGMYALFKAAADDLAVAVKLDPKPVLVADPLIDIAQAMGARDFASNVVDAAITLDPRVFTARQSYFAMLRPEWGGSLEQMQLALDTWKRSLEPRQVERLGRALEDAKWRAALEPAARLVEAKRYEEAVRLYDAALAQGPSARAFAMRGFSLAQLGRHDKAIEDYGRALELDPYGACCSQVRSNRGRSHLMLKAVDKALPDLLEAAENDDPFAARELASMYAFGKHGVKRDYAVARQWCERAAKQGDGLAMYCMGSLYHAGLGVPKDLARAAHWFDQAARRNIPDAQTDLGHMLWSGQGVQPNRSQAIRWWRAAAKLGNARAARQLESRLSGWEYFKEVTLPEWQEKLIGRSA